MHGKAQLAVRCTFTLIICSNFRNLSFVVYRNVNNARAQMQYGLVIGDSPSKQTYPIWPSMNNAQLQIKCQAYQKHISIELTECNFNSCERLSLSIYACASIFDKSNFTKLNSRQKDALQSWI